MDLIVLRRESIKYSEKMPLNRLGTITTNSLSLLPIMYSLLAALLVAPSLALPATFGGTKSFAIKQVPAGKTFVSGPIQLAKTYGKYAHAGAVVPSDVKAAAAAAAAQQGSVAANPEQVRCGLGCPDETTRK
jgi:hypothetical protein